MSVAGMIWTLTIAFCAIFLYISARVQRQAKVSFAAYAIAGHSLPLYLVAFTQIATIMGVGNFSGHASMAFTRGLPHLWFILGEQGSKILFALVFAGFAGRFTYITVSEMMDDLIHRDKVSRAIVAVLTGSIMIAWTGGQGKGLGELFAALTGMPAVPMIILFSAVFIVYTAMGGIYSVVWTDLVQGILCLVFGVAFYYYALAPVRFSGAVIYEGLAKAGAAKLWTFSAPFAQVANTFLTGCLGILAAQAYWQRCYASKTPKIARDGMLAGGIVAVVFTMLTALVGIATRSIAPNIKAGQVVAYLMANLVPIWVVGVIFTLMLAAGMSSADSCLNSAAVIVVNDLIKPFGKFDDETLVKMSVWLTVALGIFACAAAVVSPTIIGLFSKAYTLAGGGIVPVLLVGLAWKKTGLPFQMGTRNSRVTAWGARVGLVAGAAISYKYGVLYGAPVGLVATALVSALTQAKDE